jgi:hypothetical protein
MNEVDELLLEHFGTKGMQWGVRKERKQAARNVRAQKFVDKANILDEKIKDLGTDTKGARNILKRREIKKLTEKKESALDDAERKRQGNLSKRQKKVAIGAGIAGTIVASYVTYSALNSGNARRLASKGKDFVLQKKGLPWKLKPELRDPNLDVDGIMNNVVSHINPNYGATGTKNNCRRATYAYEMRRRGYDVAATRTHTGRGQDITGVFNVQTPGANLVPVGVSGAAARVIGELRKPSKPFTERASTEGANLGKQVFKGSDIGDQIRYALSKQPDGARGEFGMMFNAGGGHSMAWEKVKGVVVIFDTQTGKKYQGDEIVSLGQHLSEAGITRLDNLPLNDDFLRRWLKNA